MSQVRPGQPLVIKARDWNAAMDATEYYRRNAMRLGGGDGPSSIPAHEVLVRNDSAGDVDRFAVLALREAIITPDVNEADFIRRQAYVAVEPDRPDDLVVVTREPIVAGALGRAVFSGLTPAKVNVVSEHHRYIRPVPGDVYRFQSAPWGPGRLVYIGPETVEQLGTIVLDNRPVGPCIYTTYFPTHGTTPGQVWNVTRGGLADLGNIATSDTVALVIDTPDVNHMTVLAEGAWFAPDFVPADQPGFLGTTPGSLTTDPSGDGTWRMLLHREHPDGLVFWYPRLQRNIGICVGSTEVPHWVDCEAI